MEIEQDTLNTLIQYLLSHGYPPESLALEYPLSKFQVDLAVVDLDTNEPIALFEAKQIKTPNNEKLGRKQLETFLEDLGNKSIPAYLVFPKEIDPFFELQKYSVEEKIDGIAKDFIPRKDIIDFDVLQKSGRNLQKAEIKQKRKRTIDRFTSICIVLAAILIILLLLDSIGVLEITPIHLTVGAAIIALILIPYANKLKILGFEFERLLKDKQTKE